MGTPLIATKANAFPFTCELVEVVVLVLKVEASGIASIIFYHLVVVAQGCDLRLSISFIRGEKECEE
jgi:hypothetical protein